MHVTLLPRETFERNPNRRKEGPDMDILLRIECDSCGKFMIVDDADVGDHGLDCPFCSSDISIPDDD